MRFLTREDDQQTPARANEGPDGRLDAIRAEGCELLSAADDAIQKALAGSNSETFLRATRQQGGE